MQPSDVMICSAQTIDQSSPKDVRVEGAPGIGSPPLEVDKPTANSAGEFTMGKVSTKKRPKMRKQTSKLLNKVTKLNAELAADAGV